MFDELIITPVEITADETLYDWYEAQREYCEDCGGVMFSGVDGYECYMCLKGGEN